MSYDHKTGTANGPVKVGDNPLAPHDDNHGSPAMIVDDAGYIHVVYGGHGQHAGKQAHAVTQTPEDISSWEILDNIDHETTYPQFIKKNDGTLYLFYRDGIHQHDWEYVTSTDNGRTFSDPTVIASAGEKRTGGYGEDSVYLDSWYLRFRKGRNDSIHMTGMYHAHGPWKTESNLPHIHPYNRFNRYYMQMTSEGTWKNAARETIDLPFDKTEADEKMLVYDTGMDFALPPAKMAYHDVGNSNSSRGVFQVPHLVFTTKHGRSGFTFARWDGDSWEIHEEDVPYGPMFMKSPQDIRIYNSGRYGSDAEPGIGVYQSTDRGQTWQKIEDMPDSKGNLRRQEVIQNYHDDAKVYAYTPSSEKNSVPVYMYGESGFVTSDNNPSCPPNN
ncbi:BNR-4 repeat-containing protein [Halocatena marina]|uniref:BNR-4 repeat-containing protein n=1 Tax=Halocatena marina TaxID=2934937 RepID=A0ABD5YUU9_9EURY|nr:BNR-4 repeat-containing protein [Halocatena marina]